MSESLRSGVLTYLFTDLEDSTRLWEHFPREMQSALAAHDQLLRKVVEAHHGHVVKTTGDGIHAVFQNASEAAAAALGIQQAITLADWPEATGPLRVRVGLHSGESQVRDGDYYGSEVNLAARVMGLGHGGQVLLSEVTTALTQRTLPEGCSLIDLGQHRVKGVAAAQHVFQLSHPDLPDTFPSLKSLSFYKHNLPGQLTRFIGRENEMDRVLHALNENRLVTLLGPGGTGKTRLMLQAAEEVIDVYSDGVWLVELAPLTDSDMIPERVASALKIQEQPENSVLDSIVEYLRRKECLILLDNVEHVVRESAALAEHLLTNCPRLKILVTGREALFISGEVTLQVPSLSVPEKTTEGTRLESLESSESVQLFLERARAVRPDFSLSPDNAAALADLVRRLDGIPLALELAAARLRMLSVEKITERLNDRFRLLTGGSRTALPRQQTLQALIDWSWKLLDENEQILLRRLSVFSGGWTLEAAENVCGYEPLDEFAVFDHLEQLINKSLVTVEHRSSGEPRYGMLESIRQFARDRLFEAEEGAQLRERHADYFVSFCEEAGNHLDGPDMMIWVERLRNDLDNQRAVMAWTLEDRPELALRLSGVLSYQQGFWMSVREARSWLDEVVRRTRPGLEAGDPAIQPVHFIRALVALGMSQNLLGRTEALTLLDEASQLARKHGEERLLILSMAMSLYTAPYADLGERIGDVVETVKTGQAKGYDLEVAIGQMIIGVFMLYSGDYSQGREYLQASVPVVQKMNNTRSLAILQEMQGHQHMINEELQKANESYRMAMENYRRIDDTRRETLNASYVAHILRRLGQIDEARAAYRKNILSWQEMGHQSAVAHQLECFAMLSIAEGQHEEAARLLGAARSHRERIGSKTKIPQEIAEMQAALDTLAECMGAQRRELLMEEGALLSVDEAVQFAVHMGSRQ